MNSNSFKLVKLKTDLILKLYKITLAYGNKSV